MLTLLALAAALQAAPAPSPVAIGATYRPSNPFARILRGELTAAKVAETRDALAFMDGAPAQPGHVLVIPKAPVVNLFDATPEQLGAVISLAKCVAEAQRKAFADDGMTGLILKTNSGVPAQGMPHLHVHLLPTYGDRPDAQRAGLLPTEALEPVAARIRAALPTGGCATAGSRAP